MMNGKITREDLLADEEWLEPSPKKSKTRAVNVRLDDPMDLENPEENYPKQQCSAFITRLSECFLRSQIRLDNMGDASTQNF